MESVSAARRFTYQTRLRQLGLAQMATAARAGAPVRPRQSRRACRVRAMTSGPIGLVGSGEFTPATEAIDLALLKGRPRKVAFLPTAAALEGPTTIKYWTQLGADHYRRLDIDASPLLVLNRDDANRADLAAELATAGLIYLSGGDPTFLATTLVGTRV